MLIIPAIDLRGGQCVRLFQGDFAQETVYDEVPADVARRFADEGAELIHVVDLDGARTGCPANLEIVEQICRSVPVPVQFGGGVRTFETAREAIERGVHRVVVGSRLVESPDFAEAIFFALGESAAAGIDARDGRVAVSGWTETSEVSAEDLAQRMEGLGARHFVVTDIARDGALLGPNVVFFHRIAEAIKGRMIASGGISDLYDFELMAEARIHHLEGVIVGRALYEGRFTVAEAKRAVARAFEKSPIAGDVSL